MLTHDADAILCAELPLMLAMTHEEAVPNRELELLVQGVFVNKGKFGKFADLGEWLKVAKEYGFHANPVTSSLDAVMALAETIRPGSWSDVMRKSLDELWLDHAPNMPITKLPVTALRTILTDLQNGLGTESAPIAAPPNPSPIARNDAGGLNDLLQRVSDALAPFSGFPAPEGAGPSDVLLRTSGELSAMLDPAQVEVTIKVSDFRRARSIHIAILEAIQGSLDALATQKTTCAACSEHKATPLRRDELGGYICLTCTDRVLDALLAPEPRPLEDWSENDGNVVWWTWRDGEWLGEPAYIGTPLDIGQGVAVSVGNNDFVAHVGGWPGYHTHWTPHPNFPREPATNAIGEAVAAE